MIFSCGTRGSVSAVGPSEKQLQTHTPTHTHMRREGSGASVGGVVRSTLQDYAASWGLAFESVHFHNNWHQPSLIWFNNMVTATKWLWCKANIVWGRTKAEHAPAAHPGAMLGQWWSVPGPPLPGPPSTPAPCAAWSPSPGAPPRRCSSPRSWSSRSETSASWKPCCRTCGQKVCQGLQSENRCGDLQLTSFTCHLQSPIHMLWLHTIWPIDTHSVFQMGEWNANIACDMEIYTKQEPTKGWE